MGISEAAAELAKGRFVIIYDGSEREGEADLVLHASHATPGKIALLRKDGGGLVCLATSGEIAERIGLPFMADVLRGAGLSGLAIGRTPYGDMSAFSLAINHRKTFTGITDEDRALTAREFANLISNGSASRQKFEKLFYSPGHLHLLVGRNLKERKGHTELALELARRAGMPPAILLCEMLGEGKALGRSAAKEYAKRHGLQFIEGSELL